MRKLRKKLIAVKQCGVSGTHILELLKVPKSTVFDAIKLLKNLGTIPIVLEEDNINLCAPKN